MAVIFSPPQTSPNLRPPPLFLSLSSSSSPFSIPDTRSHFLVSPPTNIRRPFLTHHRRCFRIAAGPGPPQPPEPGPTRSKGIAESFSRLRDTVQIFLAVLFWMSLFFWASAWDKNNRPPNKGSRFRR